MSTTLEQYGDAKTAARLAPQWLSRVIVVTSLASCLELFDFTVFALFAATIGQQFFPAANPMTSLLLAVGTFGVGFLMRPLGAIWIGRRADQNGRRAALALTTGLMTVGTAAIALCPPYARIGIAAPLVMVLARALQGLAAGGEVGAAASYAMELSPRHLRGYVLSWQLAGQGAAAFLGASMGMLLTHWLSPASLSAWGWRLPFGFGLLIAPVGAYVRHRLPDLPPHDASTGATRLPLITLFRVHGAAIALATLMMLWRTVPVYTIVFYLPSYLTHIEHWPAMVGFRCSALSALMLVVFAPLSGRLADRLPRRKPLLLMTSGLTTVLIYPLFFVMTQLHHESAMLAGVCLVSALVALGAGSGALLVLEHFPAQARASGLALSYAIGVALFGGTAQFVVTALVKWTGNPMSVAWYVAPACLVSFVAVMMFRERLRGGERA